MTAAAAAAAMGRGVRAVLPDADVVELPLADGGEGTVSTLTAALNGQLVAAPCTDALGSPITAEYGWVERRRLAIIEVATACGLERVPRHLRDPRITTTYGVGELVRNALDRGARELIIGLGGSATNDAGAGMLTALGARFRDARGREVEPGGADLARLSRLSLSNLDSRLAGVRVRIASDVVNPLLGPNGATAVFGPQKGADELAVAELDAALGNWARVVELRLGVRVRDRAGAGAAGGLGAAWLAFVPKADIVPGVELAMDATGLGEELSHADFAFTGEGSFDAQTAGGKVPWGVANLADSIGVPVVVFAGRVAEGAELPPGVRAAVPIGDGPASLEEALASGERNLERASQMVCRLLTSAGSSKR